MSTKKLKICLAMGGGVSLGTFSGSALTESLKLLLLYGKDEDGNEYSGIEIDAMSGASAGCIALGIMLRCLIDYKSMIGMTKLKNQGGVLRYLNETYPGVINFKSISHEKIEDLIALQVAQSIQEEIWVEELNLEILKKKKEDKYDPNKSFGLLSRVEIEKLVAKYISKNADKIEFKNTKILNKERFLFACSLTNLVPIKLPALERRINALRVEHGQEYRPVQNLFQSVSSYGHSEVRVIDFVFKELTPDKESDSRWLTFYNDQAEVNDYKTIKENTSFRLSEERSWNILAATFIACGAFPVGFEPVMLKRYSDEFGNSWPNKLTQMQKGINKNSEVWIDGNQKLDYKSFNFPYIDGGTFNNEPLKEAFRLSNFLDFHDPRDTSIDYDYDRIVLFVDPAIKSDDPTYNIKSYKSTNHDYKGDGKIEFKEASELGKAVSVVSGIVGALMKQGSIKEEHKVDEYIENYNLQKMLSQYLSTNNIIYNAHSPQIIKTAMDKLTHYLTKKIVPSGTRSPAGYLINLIRTTSKKNPAAFPSLSKLSKEDLTAFITDITRNEITKSHTAIDTHMDRVSTSINNVIGDATHNLTDDIKNELLKLFFITLSEVSFNTIGKDNKASRIAITPHYNGTLNRIDNSGKQVTESTDFRSVGLPGGEIAAFGGFTYKPARKYSFEYGRLCALSILADDSFRRYNRDIWDSSLANKPISPAVVDPKLNELKTSLIEEINEIRFYQNTDTYSGKMYTSLYQALVDRVKDFISLGFWTKLKAALGSFLGAFSDRLTKWMIFKIAKGKLSIDSKKLTLGLTPITIRVKSNKSHLVNILYYRKNSDKGYDISPHQIADTSYLEFQLFVYKNTNGNFSFFAKPYLDLQNVDSNFNQIAYEAINQPVSRLELKSLENVFNYKVPVEIDFKSLLNKNPAIEMAINNLDYHINPMLLIDVSQENMPHTIRFHENTTAFSLELGTKGVIKA